MTHQLSRRLAAVIGAVSIVLVSLIAAVPATAATSVDLTTQLTVPPEGTPGGPFSMTATVRNVGIDAANGSSFRVQLERGTKNVAATCATSAGGADCATNIVVTPGDATTGPVVTGDLPTLPRNGSVTITVTGTFPSTSSATTVLTAIVPAGAVDSGPGTNTVSQSTALSGTANLIVTKTQDKDSVTLGETRTYTVSYRNDGPDDLIGIYVYDIAYGPALASGTHDFSVTCATTNSAPCPEWVTGAPQSSSTAYGSMPYAGNATIPAGTTLALTVPWTVNSTACVPGGVYAIDNYAYRATTLPGMNLTGNTSAFAAGTITGPACPEAHLVVSKAQDKHTVGLGETRTYTVSYRNEGPADISDINVSDVFYGPSLPEGSQNYSVTCADASSAPCPAWANGETQTANSSGAQSVFNGSVNLPAGSELVLTIPWTINGTACIPGGFYDAENNAYRSMNPTGVNVTGDSTSRVTGIVTGTACPEANVTVEKTQDKTTVALDEIRTYTVTYRNNGPADVTALNLYDVLYGSDLPDGSHNYSVNCAESSTAPCPDWADGESHSSTGTAISPLRGNADIPAGTSLVLTVPWTVTSTSCIPGGVYNVENNAYRSSSVPGVTMTGNVTATVTGTVTCVDVSSVTKFSTSEPAPRAPLAVSTTVSNAQGTAHDIPVTVTLPRAGFIVPDAAAADLVTCAPTDSDACPTDLRYDAETHTMLGTIPTLAGGQGVTLTINGTSGVIPPTTDSYIATTTAPAAGQGDPSPQSNNSEDSFGISNEQTTATVTQRLDRPAPTALTFTGEVTCALQDAVPFTLVVPAGTTEATSVVTDKLWLHDDCTVTMTHPEAPAHYSWGEWNPSNESTHTAVSGPLTDTFAVSLISLVQEVAVPTTPAVTDPCGPGNAVYQTPANTDVFTWTSNADRTLTVKLSEGHMFTDGTTTHIYPAPVDSGVDCPVTGSPEPSTPIDPVDPSTEPHIDPGTKPQPSTTATDALANTGTSPAAGWVVAALFLLTAGSVLTALRRRART